MSVLPYLSGQKSSVMFTENFLGVNKKFRIAENELSDALNMCSDDYPVLSTRKKRQISYMMIDGNNIGLPTVYENICSAVVMHDSLALLSDEGIFSYRDKEVDLGIKNNKMLCIGNQIYCYPSGTLISLPISNEDIEVSVTHQFVELAETAGVTNGKVLGVMYLQPSVPEAIGKTAYNTVAPSAPSIGDYWCPFDGYLQRYCGDEGWQSVAPSLIRVEILSSGTSESSAMQNLILSDMFSPGEAVFISGTESDYDSSYIVEAVGTGSDTAIYLSGYIAKQNNFTLGKLERKMPLVDFVTEHNGRLWGCRFGNNADGELVNEIYASALNAPTNWFKFNGTTQDSFAATVTSDGKFTGVAIVNGYVTFFKEQHMHRIYGSTPETFQLYSTDCVGVQEGCELSLATANGVTYYKSNIGIMAITDGLPVKISDALGNDVYSSAIGGTDYTKYYVSMIDSCNERKLYVYDFDTQCWHIEDSPEGLKHFFSYKNNLFAFCDCADEEIDEKIAKYEQVKTDSDPGTLAYVLASLYVSIFQRIKDGSAIYCIKTSGKVSFPNVYIKKSETEYAECELISTEESILSWYFETSDIGWAGYNKKYVNQIIAKMLVLPGSRVDIEIKYNFESEWRAVATVAGSGYVKTENCIIHPSRCDHFKLKFSGTGEMKLLNLSYIFSEGSEK